MGSEIYISNAQNVPRELLSDLKPDRSVHESLYGKLPDGKECLVYRLGIRGAVPKLPRDISEKLKDWYLQYCTPRYTIFMGSKEAFEQLPDSIPICVVGDFPHFNNIGELKKEITQSEVNGFKIKYQTQDEGIEKLLQTEKDMVLKPGISLLTR